MAAEAEVSAQPVLLQRLGAGVMTLTLNRPERLNALNAVLVEALSGAVERAGADPDCRAVLITGAGRGFCSGADLVDRAVPPGAPRPDLGQTLDKGINPLIRAIRTSPKPVVCAVNGPAAGAGANLALACDIVLAGPGARFDFPFTKLGLHPGGGATYFLVTAAGRQRALKILLEGGSVAAEQAVGYGLAASVHDDPLASALALAGRAASLDAGLVRDLKSAVSLAAESGLAASLHFESWAQAATAASDNVKAGLAAQAARRR